MNFVELCRHVAARTEALGSASLDERPEKLRALGVLLGLLIDARRTHSHGRSRFRWRQMISFVLPTLGRPGLLTALDSIELWPGDEVLVIGELANLDPYIRSSDVERGVRFLHCPRGNDWGHSERNFAQPYAKGRYIANLDDDDVFAPGARALMADAMETTPNQPVIFRMRYPNGMTLWYRSHFLGDEITGGNVGTPMMFFPNDRSKLGRWGNSYTGDFAFLKSCRWRPDEYVWRGELIALIGFDQHAERSAS